MARRTSSRKQLPPQRQDERAHRRRDARREAPGAEGRDHEQAVGERRGGLADVKSGLVVHRVVAHTPGADDRLGTPTDQAHERARHADGPPRGDPRPPRCIASTMG